MHVRFSVLCALAAVVAGCDAADPGDRALLDLTARTADGAPAAGLEVFATYGALVPGPARTSSAARADLGAPFPPPARDVVAVRFGLEAAAPVRLLVLGVAGDVLEAVTDGAFAAG